MPDGDYRTPRGRRDVSASGTVRQDSRAPLTGNSFRGQEFAHRICRHRFLAPNHLPRNRESRTRFFNNVQTGSLVREDFPKRCPVCENSPHKHSNKVVGAQLKTRRFCGRGGGITIMSTVQANNRVSSVFPMKIWGWAQNRRCVAPWGGGGGAPLKGCKRQN